ncbi:MOSC domain-containing protein [Brevibacillus dissolubilis]|uniref:MOSC domain-containing protein n=1 Tax=Brevibacillus dissolubilis TaxID=1844116 RepID=UPI001116BA8C|nr:MOSC domain-containing protein [Brevibacillus dissolubilis]
MRRVGTLVRINRFPVKSMRGERLYEAKIESYGMYGDRSHALVDEGREGKWLTAREAPQLLGYQAEFVGETADGGFPELDVTFPTTGERYRWGSEQLTAALSKRLNRSIGLRTHTREEELLAVDEAPIHLITDASVDRLEELWGQPLDPRRFRANFWVKLDEPDAFAEHDWLSHELQIGDVVLAVNKPCPRCMMIGLDPDDQKSDKTLLQTLLYERDKNFGVYCWVAQPGEVKEGDIVYLREQTAASQASR